MRSGGTSPRSLHWGLMQAEGHTGSRGAAAGCTARPSPPESSRRLCSEDSVADVPPPQGTAPAAPAPAPPAARAVGPGEEKREQPCPPTFLKWGQVTFSQRGKATSTTTKFDIVLQHFRIPPRLQRLQPPPSAFCLCSLSSHSMKSFMCLSRSLPSTAGSPPAQRREAPRGPRLPGVRTRKCAHVHTGGSAAEPRAPYRRVCVLTPIFEISWETKATVRPSGAPSLGADRLHALLQLCTTRRGGCRREACVNVYLVAVKPTPTPQRAGEGASVGK